LYQRVSFVVSLSK